MIIKTVEKEFLSINDYVKLTKQTIQKFCPQHAYLLGDDEAIDYIASKIMHGDWRWDKDKNCSRKTYRCSCAQWAIREYVCKKKPKDRTYKVLSDREHDKLCMKNWNMYTDISDLIIDINNVECLTKNERLCIQKIYIEHYRVIDLSNELNISRPVIYRLCESAIEKLQETFGV